MKNKVHYIFCSFFDVFETNKNKKIAIKLNEKITCKKTQLISFHFFAYDSIQFFICTTEDEEFFLLIVVIVFFGFKAFK